MFFPKCIHVHMFLQTKAPKKKNARPASNISPSSHIEAGEGAGTLRDPCSHPKRLRQRRAQWRSRFRCSVFFAVFSTPLGLPGFFEDKNGSSRPPGLALANIVSRMGVSQHWIWTPKIVAVASCLFLPYPSAWPGLSQHWTWTPKVDGVPFWLPCKTCWFNRQGRRIGMTPRKAIQLVVS